MILLLLDRKVHEAEVNRAKEKSEFYFPEEREHITQLIDLRK